MFYFAINCIICGNCLTFNSYQCPHTAISIGYALRFRTEQLYIVRTGTALPDGVYGAFTMRLRNVLALAAR